MEGEYEKAEPLLEQAFATYENLWGIAHPDTIKA